MNEPTVQVQVRLLDRELVVGVPAGERAELLACAEYLDDQLAELRRHSRVAGSDRLILLAALNVAQELLRTQRRERVLQEGIARLEALEQQLTAALDELPEG